MILHIDTSDQRIVKVSLIKDGEVIDKKLEENEFGSQVLLPLIIKLLDENNLKLEDLKEIQTETGPGSFTGLRVGASVAQALGFALGIPVNGKLNQPVELKYS